MNRDLFDELLSLLDDFAVTLRSEIEPALASIGFSTRLKALREAHNTPAPAASGKVYGPALNEPSPYMMTEAQLEELRKQGNIAYTAPTPQPGPVGRDHDGIESYADREGTIWERPTAYAYAKLCKAYSIANKRVEAVRALPRKNHVFGGRMCIDASALDRALDAATREGTP